MRNLILCLAAPLVAQVPAGFTPLLKGPNPVAAFHVSEVNHHGNTKAWKLEQPKGAPAVLTVTQEPAGNGGILLTNKSYKNFEVYVEIKPDFGCDGGLFLRSTEKGEAYQVLLDYLEGGNVSGIYGEKLEALNKEEPSEGRIDKDWRRNWKEDDWNSIRARIEGAVPHIQVWMNGVKVTDWTAKANYLPGGATSGMIALQAHRSVPGSKNERWKAGGFHRYRNLAVKELP
ncbi:MAG: DUF1080 domain-containing protein [Acidobacteria bacterium]|nr:DUF1080 domain-containing protein [Acidobacteriota bacterium]